MAAAHRDPSIVGCTVRVLGFIPRLLLIVAAGALLITATVIGVAPRVWSSMNAHEELPVELPEFEALAQRTYVYDVNGQEIGFYELENSQPIAYADIPPEVIDAFLTVEDKEFFRHDGINVRSLVRATLSNFASEAPQQGASTITMQVVKNDFLAGLERDGRYKLLQIHYARMLEKEHAEGADPRSLPQHRLLRQQRLRHRGGRRDVLRQDGTANSPSPRRPSSPVSSVRRRASIRSTSPNAVALAGSRWWHGSKDEGKVTRRGGARAAGLRAAVTREDPA